MTIEEYLKKELYNTTYKEGHKYIDLLFNKANKKLNTYNLIDYIVKLIFLKNENNSLHIENEPNNIISLKFEGNNVACLYMLMYALKRVASHEKIDFDDIINFMNNIE